MDDNLGQQMLHCSVFTEEAYFSCSYVLLFCYLLPFLHLMHIPLSDVVRF